MVAGGGTNHRVGLYDGILIKENHAALAGGVGAAVRKATPMRPGLPLEVECSTLAEVDEALAGGEAARILLDNMDNEQLRAAVGHVAGRAELEASGGFTLDDDQSSRGDRRRLHLGRCADPQRARTGPLAPARIRRASKMTRTAHAHSERPSY